MKPPVVSLEAVLLTVAGLWRATLLTTTWGQSDGATYLDASALNNERRTYNGTGNNIAHPEWGSVGQKQLRSVTGADYSDGISTPPGEDRPTPRELLSEVFLTAPPSSSATSALFVGWGLLVGFDLFLHEDNASEPLDIACDDPLLADVWCPLGSLSEPISFNRSQGGIDADGGGARSPTNFATSYLDLDWLYGRDEDSAAALRTLALGYLNLATDELPHLLPDGTWLVADQRPTTMPVTFALMTLLLREHNRCCDERASGWDADTDEDAYQVCRQWTIAVFQHITENDFAVRLVGESVKVLGAAFYNVFYDDDDGTASTRRQRRWKRQRRRRLLISENSVRSLSGAPTNGTYDLETNAGADTVFSTVAIPAFYSALSPTVGLLDDNFKVANEHGIELATASADVAGLIKRTGGIESIIRGAAYSRTQAMDISFMAQVSAYSPQFNLPVVAVQRGRDHGIPSYNDVREAYGLSKVTTFEDVTSDVTVQGVLEGAYGKVELLDAYTGALAESEDGSGLFVGPLLQAVFLEQLYRAIVGDRHHHSHDTQNEDAALSTLRGLILNNSLVSSMALDAFTAPDTAASSTCSSTEVTEVYLADGFKLAWNTTAETDGELMHLTISARGIETQGMIAIGFGGRGMVGTDDFVICVVSSESMANCTDHSGPKGRSIPPLDVGDDAELEVVNVTSIGEWTSVTFARWGSGNDASDYPLTDDIAAGDDTPIIYSWRSGEGIGKHPNSQRGDALVNFAYATVSPTCDESTNYYALHGALLLVVWMLIAPYGIYQARYRKGQKSLLGNLWWEMHEECMVICAEALLPLAITAIFTTGGPHNSEHAAWGLYMVGAMVLQIVTGWARSRALSAKGNNFSLFHRLNKHVHIYSGWFTYMAGLVQCYRGLELVAGAEKLVFSAVDIDFTIGNFEVVRSTLFPIWLAIVPPIFFALEARKQFMRFFTKGVAQLCCMVEIINDDFSDEAVKKEVEDRLMPRTQDLPLYTTLEFNDKILHGRAWVIVDAAVLDVSSFAKRHPGGARLIMNSMGTDMTSEIIGEDASVGNSSMTFAPHPHSDTALEIARSLVVGYIEEDDTDTDASSEDEDGDGASSGTDVESSSRHYHLRARHRRPSLSGSDGESAASDSVHERRESFSTDGSTDSQQKRSSVAPEGKNNKAPGDIMPVGATMALSAQAAAILNARSPVPKTPPPPPPPPLPPPLPARVYMDAAGGAEFGDMPVVEGGTLPFVRTPAALVSSVSGRWQKPLSWVRKTSFNRPVELEHPIERNTAVPSRYKTAVTGKTPNINPIRRFLGRIGTMVGVTSGGGVDESDDRQEDRPLNNTRRVRKIKNALDFFHVCPLLMHEKMGDSAGRPVYKFVFACPGRAGALVRAMTGVCHFHMRVAQEAGMTVVQRSYNAFAVRVQSGEGIKRQVVPACGTREGELCIEMRIKIYPDGVMSNLLLKLAKDSDNPAVQLKGPFLQDKLIPPPTHRNVIMIAAGTGINPMIQMIRNYIHPDCHTHGVLLAAHLRLVLIWQNNAEGDLFCAGELTMLQMKAKGLLEVTALISGDITRRNVPGNAFRRAKVRLIKKSRKAGLVSRGAGGTGDTDADKGGTREQTLRREASSGAGKNNEFKQADGDNFNDEVVRGVSLHRHKFERALSRVTEEECMSRESSLARDVGGFWGRKVETGGGSGDIFPSPNIPLTGTQELNFAIGDGGKSSGVPWSANRGERAEGSAGDSDRHPQLSRGGMEERDGSRRGGEGVRIADRQEGAGEPSVAASSANSSTGMVREEEDCAKSGGGDSCATLRRDSNSEGSMKRSSSTFNRQEASDMSRTDGDSRGEGTGYGGIGLVGTRREATSGRHYRSKGNRMKSNSGRSHESGGSSGGVTQAQAAKSPRRPPLGLLKSSKIGVATNSSDEEFKIDDAVAGSDGGRPPRLHRHIALTPPSSSSLPTPPPSVRHRLRRSEKSSARPGVNTHSHLTARRSRSKWSRTRLSARDKVSEPLTESPLEDLGNGLHYAKLSRTVLQEAIGPDVMTAIASTKASAVDDASQKESSGTGGDSRSSLEDLVGTETTGGTLQVVVSGPAGFVFCAEGLLAELGIPPQAVVLLD